LPQFTRNYIHLVPWYITFNFIFDLWVLLYYYWRPADLLSEMIQLLLARSRDSWFGIANVLHKPWWLWRKMRVLNNLNRFVVKKSRISANNTHAVLLILDSNGWLQVKMRVGNNVTLRRPFLAPSSQFRSSHITHFPMLATCWGLSWLTSFFLNRVFWLETGCSLIILSTYDDFQHQIFLIWIFVWD